MCNWNWAIQSTIVWVWCITLQGNVFVYTLAYTVPRVISCSVQKSKLRYNWSYINCIVLLLYTLYNLLQYTVPRCAMYWDEILLLASYFIILKADTIVDPRAVVVHLESAVLAHWAVVGSVWLDAETLLTVPHLAHHHVAQRVGHADTHRVLHTPLLNRAC